jgi:hypothetical protein
VFEKEVPAGENGSFIAYNVSLKRVFKQDAEYKSTQGFRSDDLPFVIQLLGQAYGWINEQQNRE